MAMSGDALSTPEVTILPVGGLGAIGMNCMLIGVGEDMILVDCGAMVPGKREPGVASVLPDFDLLLAHRGRLRAIVLTHGHEDHIGALPWLLRHVDAPVNGSRFTLGLLADKLSYAKVEAAGGLHRIEARQRVVIGALAVQFFQVTHSIPDAFALAIDTPAGRVVHTGDFRLDPNPAHGTPSDESGLRALGDDGVLLMMSDSTNATVSGHTRSEAEVARAIGDVIKAAPGRVLVGMFSSNVARGAAVLRAARAAGRKVATAGRSMQRYLEVARKHADLNVGQVRDADHLPSARVDDERLVILCTGSQGERRGALRRIALGEHPTIQIRPDDTLVLSARAIPGNEVEVRQLSDDFLRAGARVIHGGLNPAIHGSGHAAEEELRTMLSWLRPRFFLPLHGTVEFMLRHAALAREHGVSETLLARNGQRLVVSSGGFSIAETMPWRPWYAVGEVIGDEATAGLRQRRALSWQGVLAVVATRRGGSWQVAVQAQGVVFGEGDGVADLQATLERALRSRARVQDEESIATILRQRSRRYVKAISRQRPEVLTFVDG